MIDVAAAIQRHLDRLEEWAVKDLMKFNQDKFQVLLLERKIPLQ